MLMLLMLLMRRPRLLRVLRVMLLRLNVPLMLLLGVLPMLFAPLLGLLTLPTGLNDMRS
jgi:hypothetical protein